MQPFAISVHKAIHESDKEKFVRLMAKASSDSVQDQTDALGMTTLHKAVLFENPDIIRLLEGDGEKNLQMVPDKVRRYKAWPGQCRNQQCKSKFNKP